MIATYMTWAQSEITLRLDTSQVTHPVSLRLKQTNSVLTLTKLDAVKYQSFAVIRPKI